MKCKLLFLLFFLLIFSFCSNDKSTDSQREDILEVTKVANQPASKTDKSLKIESGPELALYNYYLGIFDRDPKRLRSVVTTDGEFADFQDFPKDFDSSKLIKVLFLKKGLYQGNQAILALQYFSREMRKELGSSAFFEDRFVVLPGIFTLKKENEIWKVHRQYSGHAGGEYYPHSKTRFKKFENEKKMGYYLIRKDGKLTKIYQPSLNQKIKDPVDSSNNIKPHFASKLFERTGIFTIRYPNNWYVFNKPGFVLISPENKDIENEDPRTMFFILYNLSRAGLKPVKTIDEAFSSLSEIFHEKNCFLNYRDIMLKGNKWKVAEFHSGFGDFSVKMKGWLAVTKWRNTIIPVLAATLPKDYPKNKEVFVLTLKSIIFDSDSYKESTRDTQAISLSCSTFRGSNQRRGVYDTKPVPWLNETVWKFRAGEEIESSPIVSDGLVFFSSEDEYFYALDIKTGEKKWSYKTDEEVTSSPSVCDGIIYFGCEDNYLYSLYVKNGQEKWRYRADDQIRSSSLVHNEIVYFGCDDAKFYAVNIRDGSPKYKVTVSDQIRSSPAIYENIIVFGCDDGQLYALEASSGKIRWKFPVATRIRSTPCIVQGTVFVTGTTGNSCLITAIDLKSGKAKWNHQSLRTNFQPRFVSSPAIYNGIVYYGDGNNYLYALDAETGKVKWKSPVGKGMSSSPTICRGILYFGNSNSYLYAINVTNGSLIWKFKTGKKIKSSPCIHEGVIYVGSNDNFFYALK